MRLYLHVPFCLSKCPYCDFVSAPAGSGTRSAYLRALMKEMALAGESGRDRAGIESLYCGGGTPSVYHPSDLAGLLERAGDIWGWSDGAEVTVEINPATWDRHELEAAVAAGFNRLSIGAQSFDDGVLEALGRSHGAAESRRLVGDAVGLEAAEVSLDLIFGVPGQAPDAWKRTLEDAVGLGPGHVSAYALTIESSTAMGRAVAAGEVIMPPDETVAEMYDETCRVLASAGYVHYEISNFALPGKECRHNQACWRRQDYLGLGVGAHSFEAPDSRWRNVADVADYIARLEEGCAPLEEEERLGPAEVREEEILLALRTAEGVETDKLREPGGGAPVEGGAWKALEDAGLAWIRGSRRGLTERGMFVSNDIIASLLPG